MSFIPLVSKVVGFGLDLFIRNRAQREQLKANFDAFVRKFDTDSRESGNMHKEYGDMKRDSLERVPKDKGKGG